MTAHDKTIPQRRRKESAGFIHDANARNDQKVLRLRAAGGWAYYGLYFACLEVMRDDSTYSIQADAVPAIALSLNERADDFQTFLDLAVNYGLFERDENGAIRSRSLLERMERYEAAIEQRRKAGQSSAQKRSQLPLNDRSTAAPTVVDDSSNDPNRTKTELELETELEPENQLEPKPEEPADPPKPQQPAKPPKRGRSEKYKTYQESDFEFPPLWDNEARDALKLWVGYKARSGHPCIIDSYRIQVRQFATEPQRYAALVNRAVAKGWRGLNEESPLGSKSQSAYQIQTHLDLIAKLEKEERDAN